MPNIPSIGERVAEGVYAQVHSSFERVVNLQSGAALVSVCARSLCPGPFRIILDRARVDEIKNLQVTRGQLCFNGIVILHDTFHIYKTPDFTETKCETVNQNLKTLSALLDDKAPEFSMEQLRKANFGSELSFRSVWSADIRRCHDLLNQGAIGAAIQTIKGKGYGLTPSGDDFVLGFMLGASWLERVLKKELSKTKAEIIREFHSAEPLTTAFLHQAETLEPDQDWANLLLDLGKEDADIAQLLDKILSMGSTSGADMVSGFCAASEIL